MRIRSPVSRASFAIRFSAFDVGWALFSPWLALWIRGAHLLSADDWTVAAGYCLASFVFSLIAFLIFRTRAGMTHLFSVHDALEVGKAVLLSEFMTFIALFTVTRLNGIPRSTPLIHALVMAAGLIIARAFVRMRHSDIDTSAPTGQGPVEHIVMIGSNKLASLYIGFLQAYAPEQHSVVAVLDDQEEMSGRSIAGVRILGPSNHLQPIIEEFKEHGIDVDRVIVAGESSFLSEVAMAVVSGVCQEYGLRMDFVPDLIGLSALQAPLLGMRPDTATSVPAGIAMRRYFYVKRYIDFGMSLLLIVALLPVLLIVATVALLDVGSPVFFWQRRVGMNGQTFQMHKFRTLKPAFDWSGWPVSTTDRMSSVGTLLRKFRLDELPQLLNVLVGDMSLIGPRPLLPHDQPPNRTLRLMVRPGITGWAQVNGGKLLSPEEKNALDEWYIRNASLWLDLKIVARTIPFLLIGSHSDSGSTAPQFPDTMTPSHHGSAQDS